MRKNKVVALLVCMFIIFTPIRSLSLGENPPQVPNEPDIVSVALSSNSHVAGSVNSTTVTVDTSNVPDDTSVSAQLVESDGTTAVSGVNSASGSIVDDTEQLSLSVPAGIAAGSYKVKVSISSLNLTDASAVYTITQGGQISIVSVTPNITGHVTGTQQTVLVDLVTENVSNNTTATVSLVNGNGNAVTGVNAVTGQINNNTANDISLVIASSIAAGSYFIKVTVSSVSDSDTAYQISSQSNDPAISGVALSSSNQNVGTVGTINVTVSSSFVEDNTDVTLSLVDSNYDPVAGVSTVTADIVSNSAVAVFTVPAAVPQGNYYIKALITNIDPVYSSIYQVKVPSPTITSISTTGATLVAGSISGNLTITGTNFSATANNNSVEIINSSTNAVVSTLIPSSASTTSLTVGIPAGLAAGTYKVKETVNSKSVISSATFTIVALPTITSFTTNGATLTAGSISGNMVIYGTNFSSTAASNSVYIINSSNNQVVGSAITPSAASATSVTTTIPTGLTAGNYKVRVTTGGNSVTSTDTFTIAAGVSTVTITALSTAGATLTAGGVSGSITITGTGFSATASQNSISILNSATLQEVGSSITPSVASTTSLTAALPTGLTAGTYKVKVTIGVNNATSSGSFTISAAAGGGLPAVGGNVGDTTGKAEEGVTTTQTNEDGSTTTIDTGTGKAVTQYSSELITSMINTSNELTFDLPTVDVQKQEILLDMGAVSQIVSNQVEVGITSGNATLQIPFSIFEDYVNSSLIVEVTTLEDDEITELEDQIVNGELEINGPVVEFTINAVEGTTQQEVTTFNSKIKIELDMGGSNISGVDTRKLSVYYLEEPAMVWRYLGGKYNAETNKMEVETGHFTKFAVMEYKKIFTDVAQGNWAKDYIELLAAKQITTGVDQNNFNPLGTVTRAQFATFLVRALDINLGSYKGTFTDVAQGKWYSLYIEEAEAAGLVRGVGNGKFNPDGNVTRQEMAVMAMNAYQYLSNKDISVEAGKSSASFGDMSNISGWALESVLAAQANGIINGTPDNLFEPKAQAKRDAAAKIIIKLLEVMGKI